MGSKQNWWRKTIARTVRRSVGVKPSPLSVRPRCEPLEARDVPATFAVTNTGDNGGINPAPFAGTGTLRQAILDADATVGGDQITFNIPGSGVRTISTFSALPAVTEAVTIDGWSQGVFEGIAGYMGPPLIEISGRSAGAGVDGFTFTAGGNVVRGLVINGFAGNGIVLTDTTSTQARNSWVYGNYIGTTAAGTAAAGNGGTGVFVTTANGANNGNLIGTDADGTNDAAERNVISGNVGYGVYVAIGNNTGTRTLVRGNSIGTDAGGLAAVPNGVGVGLESNGSTVGGTGTEAVPTAAGNLISGNRAQGVLVFADVAVIAGNVIGLNAPGTARLGNNVGVTVYQTGFGTVRVGTDADGTADAAEANTISGNAGAAVVLDSATHNVVAGNVIGVAGLGNLGDGVIVQQFFSSGEKADDNTLGGATAAARNTIRFNAGAGIRFTGSDITGNTVQGNVVGNNQFGLQFDAGVDLTANTFAGNFVGTDATATQSLGNSVGVLITSSGNAISAPAVLDPSVNTIAGNATLLRIDGSDNVLTGLRLGTNAAGTAAFAGALRNGVGLVLTGDANTVGGAAANVVSGNSGDGIQVAGSGNVVVGSRVGTDATGLQVVGNGGVGVFLGRLATGTAVGGPAAGDGNLITGNANGGVVLFLTGGNSVQGNTVGGLASGTAAPRQRRGGRLPGQRHRGDGVRQRHPRQRRGRRVHQRRPRLRGVVRQRDPGEPDQRHLGGRGQLRPRGRGIHHRHGVQERGGRQSDRHGRGRHHRRRERDRYPDRRRGERQHCRRDDGRGCQRHQREQDLRRPDCGGGHDE